MKKSYFSRSRFYINYKIFISIVHNFSNWSFKSAVSKFCNIYKNSKTTHFQVLFEEKLIELFLSAHSVLTWNKCRSYLLTTVRRKKIQKKRSRKGQLGKDDLNYSVVFHCDDIIDLCSDIIKRGNWNTSILWSLTSLSGQRL